MGKTTLLFNSLKYILERKYFTGGMILIDLKHSKGYQDVIDELKSMLVRELKLRLERNHRLKDILQKCSHEEFVEILCCFFGQKKEPYEELILHN